MSSNAFFNSDSASLTTPLHSSLAAIDEIWESALSLQAAETEPPASPEYAEPFNIWLDSFLIIPILGWFLLIASVLTTFFKSSKSAQTSVLQRSGRCKAEFKQKQLIPCAKCRYFSPSSHLHCAVRPSNVLTTEAIDCSDYAAMHEPK
jgi:hypothetical protein